MVQIQTCRQNTHKVFFKEMEALAKKHKSTYEMPQLKSFVCMLLLKIKFKTNKNTAVE